MDVLGQCLNIFCIASIVANCSLCYTSCGHEMSLFWVADSFSCIFQLFCFACFFLCVFVGFILFLSVLVFEEKLSTVFGPYIPVYMHGMMYSIALSRPSCGSRQ